MKIMQGRMAGRAVLITGGVRGIGRGIARCMAREGARVAVGYLSRADAAEETVAELAALGAEALCVQADVASADQVEAMVARVMDRFGAVDCLVNNAGLARQQEIESTTAKDWDDVVDTNLKGAFLCAKAVFPHMKERGYGRIIMITSVVAERGALNGLVHYTASKAGLAGLAMTLARDGAPYGITVNCIAPGIVRSDMLYETHGLEGVAKLAAMVPLNRLGDPEDIGWAAVYLASEGSYVTGATIDVNGGMNMR